MGGLILSRKCGESVIFGDKVIVVKVLQIKKNQVHLHISAPREVIVNRDEVYLRICKERPTSEVS